LDVKEITKFISSYFIKLHSLLVFNSLFIRLVRCFALQLHFAHCLFYIALSLLYCCGKYNTQEIFKNKCQ